MMAEVIEVALIMHFYATGHKNNCDLNIFIVILRFKMFNTFTDGVHVLTDLLC